MLGIGEMVAGTWGDLRYEDVYDAVNEAEAKSTRKEEEKEKRRKIEFRMDRETRK